MWDMLEILDSFPKPCSAFALWHKGELVADATVKHHKQQAGAASRACWWLVPLCGEALHQLYPCLLDMESEPHKQQGKLMEYQTLSQACGLPQLYLQMLWQLKAFNGHTHPHQAIAERFVNELHNRVHTRVITYFSTYTSVLVLQFRV